MNLFPIHKENKSWGMKIKACIAYLRINILFIWKFISRYIKKMKMHANMYRKIITCNWRSNQKINSKKSHQILIFTSHNWQQCGQGNKKFWKISWFSSLFMYNYLLITFWRIVKKLLQSHFSWILPKRNFSNLITKNCNTYVRSLSSHVTHFQGTKKYLLFAVAFW